jgi:hypothetical protein
MSVQSTAQIDTFAAHCAPAWWRPPPRRTTCTRVHSHLTSALFTTAGFTQRWTRREDGNVRLVVCNVGGNERYFYLWNAVVKVKHFHTREHAPPLLRVVDLVKAAPFERSRVLSEFETALEEKWRAARALLEQDDTIGSAALFDEIFRVYHRLLGKNHALTAQATAALAQLRWNRGDLAGAESLLQDALASRRRALGERHMVTTETRRDLSELQRLLGRKEA